MVGLVERRLFAWGFVADVRVCRALELRELSVKLYMMCTARHHGDNGLVRASSCHFPELIVVLKHVLEGIVDATNQSHPNFANFARQSHMNK